MARLWIFAGVVAFLAVGGYAYTLRSALAATRAAAWQQNAEAQSWKTKFEQADKASKTSATAAQACEQNAKDLKTQLETLQSKGRRKV